MCDSQALGWLKFKLSDKFTFIEIGPSTLVMVVPNAIVSEFVSEHAKNNTEGLKATD